MEIRKPWYKADSIWIVRESIWIGRESICIGSESIRICSELIWIGSELLWIGSKLIAAKTIIVDKLKRKLLVILHSSFFIFFFVEDHWLVVVLRHFFRFRWFEGDPGSDVSRFNRFNGSHTKCRNRKQNLGLIVYLYSGALEFNSSFEDVILTRYIWVGRRKLAFKNNRRLLSAKLLLTRWLSGTSDALYIHHTRELF